MSWKRLEGSGVSLDLTPGLEARIADPLWFLSRQWQTGEFAGEDAASPVEAVAEVDWQPLSEVRLTLQGAPQAINATTGSPLEARVECESVRNGPSRVRVAAEAALQLLRLVRAKTHDPGLLKRMQLMHPLMLPADDDFDTRGRLELRLLAATAFDGLALAESLAAGAKPDPAITTVFKPWLATTQAQYVDPTDTSSTAWNAERMEYRFEIAAPNFAEGTKLEAREYPGGHLDWQAFDMAAKQKVVLADQSKQTVRMETIPVPVTYAGMPAPRWWTFEDGAVNWGDIQGGPSDLARYLVATFATVYGDDWFLVPVDLPRGCLAQTKSVRLRDSFGRPYRIEATAVHDHERVGASRTFRVFELTGDLAPSAGFAPRLLLPPSLPTHEEGEPREEVLFLRDEVANLAWAVERVIESPAGRRVFRGPEDQGETPREKPSDGAWGYDLASHVPPHFVPLVPVRINGSAAIHFQRGRIATTTGTSGARGLLLEPDRRLLLHEEEIPTSGVRVTRAYQLARSPDGAVHLWSGRRKSPNAKLRGPGLVHDALKITEAARD